VSYFKRKVKCKLAKYMRNIENSRATAALNFEEISGEITIVNAVGIRVSSVFPADSAATAVPLVDGSCASRPSAAAASAFYHMMTAAAASAVPSLTAQAAAVVSDDVPFPMACGWQAGGR
jgi:hypothetical protein